MTPTTEEPLLTPAYLRTRVLRPPRTHLISNLALLLEEPRKAAEVATHLRWYDDKRRYARIEDQDIYYGLRDPEVRYADYDRFARLRVTDPQAAWELFATLGRIAFDWIDEPRRRFWSSKTGYASAPATIFDVLTYAADARGMARAELLTREFAAEMKLPQPRSFGWAAIPREPNRSVVGSAPLLRWNSDGTIWDLKPDWDEIRRPAPSRILQAITETGYGLQSLEKDGSAVLLAPAL